MTAKGAGNVGLPVLQGETVSEMELSEQRGGFRIGTLDIQLGADIRSYVGGHLVMQTSLSWTDVATSVQHVFPDEASPALAGNIVTGLLTGSGLLLNLGNEKIVYANGGQTAFVQRSDGTIQNIIVNTASNVDLRQEVNVQLDVRGMAPVQSAILATRIGSAVASMGRLALLMRGTD